MTQPFADALTWMPKSRALGATLTRAYDMARAQGHQAVLLEHLLQALVEDPDASAMLLQCNIDLLGLNAAVAEHLQRQPVNENTQPEASQGLLLILEYAAAAARQSKRSEVTGAIVLAAMVGEGKSEAARMLTTAGLTFQDAISALRKVPPGRPQMQEAVAPPAVEPPPLPGASKTSTAVAPPPLPDRLPPAQPVGEASTPPPVPQPPAGAASASAAQPMNARTPMEEDPLTTARRRVAALKSVPGGAPLPHAIREPVDAAEPKLIAVGQIATSFAGADVDPQAEGAPQAWVPPPATGGAGSAGARPSRLPPPIPPMPPRPASNVTPFAKPAETRATARAPWADPQAASADILAPLSVPTTAPVIGVPIDVRRLAAGLPQRLRERVAATIEVRIPRSAVMGTAAAMRAAADDTKETALTRAVCVTLKAPSGGLFLETAAPETQWFDNRGYTRDDDEVRWRWVVTPQSSGTKEVVLAVSMRTIAADGTMIETALPEAVASIKVSSNYREGLRRLGRAAIAVSVGVALTLLATGDLFSVFGLGGR